ncbi:MAG: ABC transporter substrate-binding protein [Flavobacteriaceae bacterium]|jgi:iron complex transport system substrate-binding protein|nr:ABC transporter substrate-binding protein [Flavobacteriaceae bacterium]
MNPKIFLFLLIFLPISCKKENAISDNQRTKISARIQYRNDVGFLEFQSGKFTYKIPKSKLPLQKVMLLNASLAGYFTELGEENRIVGISSPEYIYSEKIHRRIRENKIENIGNEQKYDIEKIIASKPNAIFTNYIQSFENTYDLLKKNGIEIIFIDDYLEQKPLEKAKIIELFGILFGVENKAISKYSEIEKNYNDLKKLALTAKKTPLVLSNEMYGNQWFLAGGKTSIAEFIKDAGGDYIFKENIDEKAVPLSFEEVFSKSQNAEFWVNIGNKKSKSELLTANPNYAKLKVFGIGKLYANTAKEKEKSNDYFESGTVRADLVLKDYVKIFHPELLPNYKLTYLKELD